MQGLKMVSFSVLFALSGPDIFSGMQNFTVASIDFELCNESDRMGVKKGRGRRVVQTLTETVEFLMNIL